MTKTQARLNHKYYNGRRLRNPYTWIFSFAIFTIAMMAHYGNQSSSEVYVREVVSTSTPVVIQATSTPKKVQNLNPSQKEIITLISKHFPRSGYKMIAIALAENSKLDVNAINYNCYYKGYWKKEMNPKTNTKKYVAIVTDPKVLDVQTEGVISTWCRQAVDREFAHSVDCFLLQDKKDKVNTCPKNVTLESHIEHMAQRSKVEGLGMWSSYSTGTWQEYVPMAKKLLATIN